ncbi:unnamed protein product [Parascedosporium putredinis]|uniref:Zn(2)-C6 fungal-type domain-containing protein n=1 Tax=Parascedosporium putredinis TaxID=1442378 RepID=A0A9P1HAB5_9PEZI|nr:unnamed protein product [Parascedosporium putredinis]CAI8002476.1 unnamed protein product [Parascedosporium putredinis]
MQQTGESPSALPGKVTGGGGPRVSLACIPCRTRHIKCDATRPYCHRCASSERECHYERSRRGGLDRETLAARRRVRDAHEAATAASSSPCASSPFPSSSSASTDSSSSPAEKSVAVSGVDVPAHQLARPLWCPISVDDVDAGQQQQQQQQHQPQLLHGNISFGLQQFSHFYSEPAPSVCLDPDLVDDRLILAYYEHFHRLHPCALPRRRLTDLYRDPADRAALEPVVTVLRFLGSTYASPDQAGPLKEQAKRRVSTVSSDSPAARAFMAQARLLLSIGLFWYGEKADARMAMEAAKQLAFDLGLFRREFAPQHGRGDPVLEECWRRTWWQIFIVDAYYAAMSRTIKFSSQNFDATADLPCEESEYEEGTIPVPKTLEEFDCREFELDDHVYSSFAYHVGAIRCISSVTAVAPLEPSGELPAQLVADVDAIIDGWLLLLPACKREIITGKDGLVDELMFQAHMALHALVVGFHRPYSDLLFNPLEILSSCKMATPDTCTIGSLINVHTVRCLKAIEGQIRLMALPARPFHHTPFTICMIIAGTIPFLSACKFLFPSERLAIARHQIRLSIGCLKALAAAWPQGVINIREIDESYETSTEDVVSFTTMEDALQSCWDVSGISTDASLYAGTSIG